jgi:hypothetical protein
VLCRYLDVKPEDEFNEAPRADQAAVNAAYDDAGPGDDAIYDNATPEQGQQFAEFLNSNVQSQPLYGTSSYASTASVVLPCAPSIRSVRVALTSGVLWSCRRGGRRWPVVRRRSRTRMGLS